MSESVPSVANAALAELLEVSPQVDAAVILRRAGGGMLASAPPTRDRRSDEFGATCMRILEAADTSRLELGREPIAQIEVATPEGHVFVVADADHVVAAVTDADPTVGLVFYDLKTALRAVREAAARTTNGHIVTAISAPDATEHSTDDDDDNAVAGKGGKWRGKKKS